MVIHCNVKNDLDRVKANLENVSSSWEYVGGLEVSQVPSIEVNTNNKIVFGFNDVHNKIEELQQHIRIEEFFLQ
jgi:hypothetical protein